VILPGNANQLGAESAFTENLRRLNGYSKDTLAEWWLLPGMRFGESEKWWKPRSLRATPHEGLDLLFFRDREGESQRLPVGTIIPPLLSGIVVGRCPDFLGETIILAHDFYDQSGRRLHTFYAHLNTPQPPQISAPLSRELPIGEIASPGKDASPCPPHLHLSLAWVDKSIPLRDFSWERFSAAETFRPDDPLLLLKQGCEPGPHGNK